MSAILDELLIAEIGAFKQTEFKNSIDETLRTKIPEILKSFSIEGHIVDIEAGPKVTSVYYDLAPGFSIKAIEAKSDDLQVKLGKSSLSISKAPEKNAWAIEVPNSESNSIPFGNVFHSNHIGMSLPAALGVDTKGRPVYLDVAKTPHMLIAGQTGSGKSVCLYSIITSLAINCSPTDLQFLLIDPKRVGFRRYKKLHNLISGNIITGVKEAILALKWLIQEMENRNSIIDECGCEDIKEFKHKLNLGQIAEMPSSKTTDMPYIVAVIDEYADLMMQSSKELEDIICRLAQKARNVGIHLILATQRPSTKIISGDIKGNLPTRIALKTATSTDSQTILGGGGAEKLLGEGDMLFLKDGNLKRIHGCYISKEEIEKIIPQLPSKDLFYFNREDIFTTDFQTYLDNCSKERPTWGEINAVCKVILDNLDDYLDEKVLSIKLGLGNEELSIIWQQLREARNNPETCKLIFEHYIKNSAFAESQFINYIIYTNFYFEDRKGNFPFLKYILGKAIKEENEIAFKSAQHFCDSSRYNTKPAIEELDKLGNPGTENSKNYLALKKIATAQTSSAKSKHTEQKSKDEKKNSSTSFSHSNATNNSTDSSASDSLAKIEDINIKQALDAFYEKGETKQAFELLEPIYERHSSNEYVLGIYLPILVNYNITQAKQTIKSLKISSPAICLAEIEIALLEDDLITVEKRINQGKKLWPNNETLKCYEILWLIKLAIVSDDIVYIEEANDVAKTFTGTDNKAEKTLQARMCEILSAMTGKMDYIANNVDREKLYSTLYSRSLGIKEIKVGPEQIVKSIQLAINMIDEDGTISVDAGLYKEHLDFSKSVKFIGCRDSIFNKSSRELPIVILDSSKACEISVPVEIEGIVFTHNEEISFDNLNTYIRYDEQLDTINKEASHESRPLTFHEPLLRIKSDFILRNIGLFDSKGDGIIFFRNSGEISNSAISRCHYGIYCKGDPSASITNTQISYCGGEGILAQCFSNLQISNCDIFSNIGGGIRDFRGDICSIQEFHASGEINIKNSHIHNNSRGLYLYHFAASAVEKCIIYDNNGIGISIASGTLSNSEIYGNTSHGIMADNDVNIRSCDIHENEKSGIWIGRNAAPVVEKCNIHNNEKIGIEIRHSASGTYSNCDIHDNECQGISVLEEAKGSFKNCHIHNNKRNGIWVYGNAAPIVEKCKIHDNKTDGELYSGILAGDDSKPQISGCEIFGHLGNGIWERKQAGGTYTNCNIHNNELRGVAIQDSASGTFSNCDVHDNKQNGIWVRGNAVPIIENCKIYDNKTEGKLYSGILADDDSKPKISGCEIFGHLDDGIWVKKQASGTYANCNIHNNNQRGVEIQDSASGTFSNCEIHNNTCQGILAIGNAKGAFRNCNIHDNKRNGLLIYESAAPIVDNCKIHGNKTDGENYPGIVVSGNSKPNISNCEICGHLSDGIWEKEQACGSYTNCNIHNNNQRGVSIQDSASGAFSNCEIHNNICNGILASDDAKGAFNNCNIHDNKRSGIYVDGKAAIIVDKCKIHNNKTEGKNYVGVYVADSSTPNFSDCEIFGHLSYGIWIKDNAYGSFTKCKIYDNKTEGKGHPGVVVSNQASPQISNCEIFGHLSYGIWIRDNAYGSFTNCKIHDNNMNGVKIEDPLNRGPQISGCPICD